MEAPTPAPETRPALQAREAPERQDPVDGFPASLGPRLAARLLNYGVDARQRNDNDEAIAAFEKAAWAVPGEAPPALNLGEALMVQGRFDEAREWLWRSARVWPESRHPWYNLGTAEWKMGRPHDALPHFRRALQYAPQDQEVRHNLGVISLATGDYAEGWEQYLWRLTVRRNKRPLSPIDPEKMAKTVTLLPEQGLGDVLYFARWFGFLKEMGVERICCPYPRKIAPVMARSDLPVECGFGEEMDGEMRIGDMPFLLARHDPCPAVPLRTEPLDDPRLDDARRPLIGLTWRAGTKNELGQWKEVPVDALVDLVRSLDGTAVILQRKSTESELLAFEKAGVPVIDYSQECEFPLFVLDLLPRLQAYVTVSNTNVHLAAGLGSQMPAMHVLVTHPPESRWMVSGEGSPWFPGMKAYRQDGHCRWPEGTFDRIREALSV